MLPTRRPGPQLDPKALSLEGAYRAYSGYLLGVTKLLVRQGYRATPTDGADLVHDFFEGAWGRLVETYDPDRLPQRAPGGDYDPFVGYLHRAFYRFGRRRITELNRIQAQGMDPSEWVHLGVPQGGDDGVDAFDLDRVRSALRALPSPDGDVLAAYLELESERLVADRLGLSRHAVRQALPRAVGSVAVHLGRPPGVTEEDWAVTAEVVLRDVPVLLAARRLGLDPEAAAQRHTHTLQTLVNGLRRPTRPPSSMPTPTPDLVRAALTAPLHAAPFDDLEARATEALVYLNSPDAEALRPTFEGVTQKRLVRFFAALEKGASYAADVPGAPAPGEAERMGAFFQATDDEATDMGGVLVDALLPRLPAPLRDLGAYFAGLPVVPIEVQEALALEPDVVAAGEEAAPLVTHGLSPASLFAAAEAVSRLVTRSYRYGELSRDEPFHLSVCEDEVIVDAPPLTLQMFVEEVSDTCGCDEATAHALLRWSVEAAGHHANLFRRLVAVPPAYPLGAICLYPGRQYGSLAEQMANPLPAAALSDPPL